MLLEEILEKLKHCKFIQLEEHFINEDLDKEILYYGKTLSEDQIEQRRQFLDDRIAKRKNLYIYPGQVNA